MAWGCWLPDGTVVHLATYGGRGEWTSRCNTLGVLGHERDVYPQLREQPRWGHREGEPGRLVELAPLEQAAPDLRLCKRCQQVARFGECITCARRAAPAPDFDGATYRRDRDHARLTGQLRRVADALADGRWWTLASLAAHTGDPEASVSARIRDLRKGKFGGYTVLAENTGGGLWRYRLARAAELHLAEP